MAITLEQDIPEHSPVRNPMRFTVRGSDLVTDTSQNASLYIIIDPSDRPSDGDTLKLTAPIIGGEILFTFRTAPAYDLNELPAYTTGSDQDYANELRDALRTKHPIIRHYSVQSLEFGFWGIQLSSRISDDDAYNLLSDPVGWVPAINTPLDVTEFVQPNGASLIFQLWALFGNAYGGAVDGHDREVYEFVLEESLPPSNTGMASMDVSSVLRSYLKPTIPPPGTVDAITAYESFMVFYMKFAEQYGADGDPVEVLPMIKSDVRWGYLAGRDEAKRVEFPDWENEVMNTVLRFLTIWPHTVAKHAKVVRVDQEEYLSFIFKPTYSILRLKADIYYETGDAETGVLLWEMEEQDNELLIVPVSIAAWNLADVNPERRIRGYRIYLTNDTDVTVSEHRYYEVDYKSYEHARQLLYWTSAGGVDTIVLHGPRNSNVQADMERSGRVVNDPTTMEAARDMVAYLNSIRTERQAGTMLLTQAELPALSDLISSESVQELVNGSWWPVELIGKDKLDTEELDKGILSRIIEYRYSLRDTANSAR